MGGVLDHFSDAHSLFFFPPLETHKTLCNPAQTEQTLQRGMKIVRHGTSFHDVEFKGKKKIF